MVITLAVAHLLTIGLDILSDALGLREIERRSLHGSDFAGGHESAVHGREVAGVNLEDILFDAVAGRVSGEVEIGVVGHVDDGGRIGSGLVGNLQGVVVREGVGHRGFYGTGEVAVPVRGFAQEFHMMFIGFQDGIYLVLPAVGPAVQAVAVVVLRQLVFHPVQGEAALVDAIGVAADGGAEVRLVVLREIIGHLVEAQHHVLQFSVFVRNHDGDDAAAEVGDAHLHALGVGEGIQGGGGTVVAVFEVVGVQTGKGGLGGAGGQPDGQRAKQEGEWFHNIQIYGKNA